MRNTVLLNFDGDIEYWFAKYYINGDWTDVEGKAKEFLEKYYAESGVGDILFNIFCQNSVTPSKVVTDRIKKFHQKNENGVAVDYSENERLSLPAKCREEHGVALTELWIEQCKEIGIRPWLSFRMSDCHCPDEITAFLRSDFIYEARRNGWTLGDEYGYFKNCMNYTVPEVRQIMLDYIKEQLSEMDVYGIELDFMREPKCFDYLNYRDVTSVFNGFMAKVRGVVDECEELHGHKIKIMLRLPRDIEFARKIGFDAVYMAKNGLIDAVVPSPRWETTDSDMPIAEWVKRLSPYGTEVFACLEINTPYGKSTTDEIAKAHTAQYYSQGSSGTYVYNIYFPFLGYPEFPYYTYDSVADVIEIWTLGDIEKCLKGTRRHLMTYEDNGFYDFGERWKPLPKRIENGVAFEIKTGKIKKGDRVTVFIGIKNGSAENTEVTLNGVPCVNSDGEQKPFVPEAQINSICDSLLSLKALNSDYPTDSQTLEIKGDFDSEITYVELKVDAAE